MVIILHYCCLYMLIILSGSRRLRFFEHSLVGLGLVYDSAGRVPKSDPWTTGAYYIELFYFIYTTHKDFGTVQI